MKKIAFALFAMTLSVGLAAAGPKKEPTALSASELKWAEVPNSGGVQVAPIWGDMMKGGHGVMVRFPAGAVHPLHTHSAAIKLVIVSGTFTYGPEGGPERSYGPGSYVEIRGGSRHTSGCTAAAPCVLFHQATGKFDMKMVGAAK